MSDLKILLYIKYDSLILSYQYDYRHYVERCVHLTALRCDVDNVWWWSAACAICSRRNSREKCVHTCIMKIRFCSMGHGYLWERDISFNWWDEMYVYFLRLCV